MKKRDKISKPLKIRRCSINYGHESRVKQRREKDKLQLIKKKNRTKLWYPVLAMHSLVSQRSLKCLAGKMVIEMWSLLIWFLARFCIFLLQLIFSQCGFPEDCTMVYQHSYLNSPSTDSFFFPPIPLCEEKILCSFSGS